MICYVLAMGKQHLGPHVVVGYGIKNFLAGPFHYVIRSPGRGWRNRGKRNRGIALTRLSFQRAIKFRGALFCMTDHLGIYCRGLKKVFVTFCARINPYTECKIQESRVNSR